LGRKATPGGKLTLRGFPEVRTIGKQRPAQLDLPCPIASRTTWGITMSVNACRFGELAGCSSKATRLSEENRNLEKIIGELGCLGTVA
jgi:hypothetical protein